MIILDVESEGLKNMRAMTTLKLNAASTAKAHIRLLLECSHFHFSISIRDAKQNEKGKELNQPLFPVLGFAEIP